MAGETTITVIGNLTRDPELRYTPSGDAVANFTIASTPRSFDRQSNEWKDGDTLFLDCSIWRQAAENVAESLQKGNRVIVTGRLKSRSWTDQNGNTRSRMEIDVDEVGPSLRYATAVVQRNSANANWQGGRGNSNAGGGWNNSQQQANQGWNNTAGGGWNNNQQQANPNWSPAPSDDQGANPWEGGQTSEPPF